MQPHSDARLRTSVRHETRRPTDKTPGARKTHPGAHCLNNPSGLCLRLLPGLGFDCVGFSYERRACLRLPLIAVLNDVVPAEDLTDALTRDAEGIRKGLGILASQVATHYLRIPH
jgi:hypothetical protein